MEQLINRPALKEHQPSRNRAPLKPLMELARRNKDFQKTSSLAQQIKERFEHYYKLESKTRNSMVAAGYENAMFMEGKQLLRPDPWKEGRFIPYTPKRPGTVELRTMNFFRFYTTNSLWKWQLSNPDVRAVAGIDTQRAREASRAADILIENHERRFFPPVVTIQEGLHGLCWGTYIWEIRYDDTQHSVSVLQPIFDQVPVSLGEGWGQCAGRCGYAGTASQFQQVQPDPLSPPMWLCPQCGGEAAVEPPATELMPSVVGANRVDLGQLSADLKPFPECYWDFTRTVEESSWFIHLRETSSKSIRRLLGDVRLPQGEGMDDFGLKIMRNLGWASAGYSETHKREIYEEPANVVEFSLGPDDLVDIVLSADEETVAGDIIPAGPLLESYPNGATFQGVNGMTVLSGIFDQHHSRTHKSGVWHAKPCSGTGQGLDDLKEVQKQFNSDNNQTTSFWRATGTPPMLYRKEAMGDKNPGYLGTGNINIPILSNNLPEGLKLEDIVAPAFQPQSVPGQFFQYIYQHLANFAQITSHITDFSGGMPGVNNKTATGAQITQANSNALFTPPLQVKGEVRLKLAYITLELYRQHFPVARYFPFQGRNGRFQGKHLAAADLDAEIQLEVVKDSELPKNTFIRREDLVMFFQMLGGAAGWVALQQQDPEFASEMAQLFNVTLRTDTYDHVGSLCQGRLDQMAALQELAPDPTILTGLAAMPPLGQIVPIAPGAIDPPIAPEELEHDLKAKWIAEWLDTVEGQTAGPVMRAAAAILVRYHFQLFGLQQGDIAMQQGAVVAASQAPGAVMGAMGQGLSTAASNQPDVNKDVPDVNKPGEITGRPKSKK